jgi:hypothetical protein
MNKPLELNTKTTTSPFLAQDAVVSLPKQSVRNAQLISHLIYDMISIRNVYMVHRMGNVIYVRWESCRMAGLGFGRVLVE